MEPIERKPDYTRQSEILNIQNTGLPIVIIGAGSIGSFVTLTACKMGFTNVGVWDADTVMEHNLPNQFYRLEDCGKLKVAALKEIVLGMTGITIQTNPLMFDGTKNPVITNGIIIACVDSMAARKLIWEHYKNNVYLRCLIEGRMGGEIGAVYTMKKDCMDIPFYESTLYSDDEAVDLPCGARAIAYNILMIASLMCKGLRNVVMKDNFPHEVVFSLNNMFLQVGE